MSDRDNQDMDPRLAAFGRLLTVVDRLRAPDGCPWDRKQTLGSMIPHLLEESYEVVDALVRDRRSAIREELGDLLMNIVLAARIAEDAGSFDFGGVSAGITDKLIRRHPHVFGETKVDSVEGVLRNWEAIKKEEREASGKSPVAASALDGVPPALPAMQRAWRLVDKASTVGFVWPDAAAAAAKLDEEVAELHAALATPHDRAALEEEIGDVLFAAAALAHRVKVDPELAARQAALRFESRFRRLETDLGKPLANASLDELLAAWTRAKDALARESAGASADVPAEWLAELRQLDRFHDRFVRRIQDLPPDRVALKPRPEGGNWSVREVVEHLVDVDDLVAGLFDRMHSDAERDGAARFPSEGLLEPPARKMNAGPGPIQGPPPKPRPDLASLAELIAAWSAGRERVKVAMGRIARFDPRRLKGPHPVFGEIDALQWGEFLALHEARHLEQIDRILAHLPT